MTTTVIANRIAIGIAAPASSHTRKVRVPPIRATRTSQNAARSARRCPGALEFCASCTSFTICANAVSEPTLVAVTRRVPTVFTVAPITSDPGALSTGMDSPVTIDSSTSDSPDSTTPSVGILAPAAPASDPRDDLAGGDLDLLPVTDHDRLRGCELQEGADGVVRAAAGAHLHPMPQQHEGGKHRGGFVEHFTAAGEGDREEYSQPAPTPTATSTIMSRVFARSAR
jgi:hypothetical protein